MSATIRLDSNYIVRAGLWVEHPVYLDTTVAYQLDVLESAAQNHTVLLNSLLASPSFLEAVITQAEADGYRLYPNNKLFVKEQIYRNMQITSAGNNLVALEYQTNNAEFNLAVTRAFIETYNNFISDLMRTRGKALIDYLNVQVNNAKLEAGKSDQALKEFLAKNPKVNLNDPGSSGGFSFLGQEDPILSILLGDQASTRERYNSLQHDLEQLQISYEAFLTGRNTFFLVRDQPALVKSLTYDNTFRLMLGGLVGLVGGILISLVVLIVVTRTDQSLAESNYARQYLGTKFVVDLPSLPLKRNPAGFLNPNRAIYPGREYRRRNFRLALIIGLLSFGLIALTVLLSRQYPANGIVVPVIALLVVGIYNWPVIGFCLGLLLLLASETFSSPDGISTYTSLPLANIASFTTIPVSVTPVELIILGTVLVTLLKGLARGEQVLDRSLTAKVIGLLAGFIAWGFLWGIVIKSGYIKAAQVEVRALIYIVVIYFLTSYFARNPQLWKALDWILSIGLTLLSFLTIWRFFALQDLTSSGIYQESLSGFNHENAILFVIFIMWCLIKLIFGSSTSTKLAAGILMIAPTFGVLVSGRRAAFASLAICLIVVLAILFVRRRKAFIITAILLVLIVPAYMMAFKNVSGPLGLPARAFSSGSAAVGSRDYNSDIYRVVEKTNVQLTLKQAPLTGIGFGQAFTRYNTMQNLDFFEYQYYTPHIQILWLWLKLGLFGWVAFWFLISSSLFKLGQLTKYAKSSQRLSLAITMGCIITAIIVYAYVDISLVNSRLMTLLGLSIALLEVSYRTLPQSEAATSRHLIYAGQAISEKELVRF